MVSAVVLRRARRGRVRGAVDRRRRAERPHLIRGARGVRPADPLRGRSETVRGLRGDARDERFRTMDIHATVVAGVAVISTLIVVWLVELARSHDGSPSGQLMAVGGLAYLGAIVF